MSVTMTGPGTFDFGGVLRRSGHRIADDVYPRQTLQVDDEDEEFCEEWACFDIPAMHEDTVSSSVRGSKGLLKKERSFEGRKSRKRSIVWCPSPQVREFEPDYERPPYQTPSGWGWAQPQSQARSFSPPPAPLLLARESTAQKTSRVHPSSESQESDSARTIWNHTVRVTAGDSQVGGAGQRQTPGLSIESQERQLSPRKPLNYTVRGAAGDSQEGEAEQGQMTTQFAIMREIEESIGLRPLVSPHDRSLKLAKQSPGSPEKKRVLGVVRLKADTESSSKTTAPAPNLRDGVYSHETRESSSKATGQVLNVRDVVHSQAYTSKYQLPSRPIASGHEAIESPRVLPRLPGPAHDLQKHASLHEAKHADPGSAAQVERARTSHASPDLLQRSPPFLHEDSLQTMKVQSEPVTSTGLERVWTTSPDNTQHSPKIVRVRTYSPATVQRHPAPAHQVKVNPNPNEFKTSSPVDIPTSSSNTLPTPAQHSHGSIAMPSLQANKATTQHPDQDSATRNLSRSERYAKNLQAEIERQVREGAKQKKSLSEQRQQETEILASLNVLVAEEHRTAVSVPEEKQKQRDMQMLDSESKHEQLGKHVESVLEQMQSISSMAEQINRKIKTEEELDDEIIAKIKTEEELDDEIIAAARADLERLKAEDSDEEYLWKDDAPSFSLMPYAELHKKAEEMRQQALRCKNAASSLNVPSDLISHSFDSDVSDKLRLFYSYLNPSKENFTKRVLEKYRLPGGGINVELLNADLRSKYSLDLSASLQEMESAANNETDRTPLWSADLRAKSSLGLRESMQEWESAATAKNETLWNADVRPRSFLGLRASMPEMESAAKDESHLGPSPWPTLKAPMRSPVSMQSQLENPASTQKVMHSPNSAWDIAEFTDRGQLQIKIATESLAKMQAVLQSMSKSKPIGHA